MAGNATVGALRVTLGLDSAAFTDGLNAAQKHLKGVGQSMQRVGATMATVGAGMTAAITGPLIAAGFAASKAASEAADAMGQVEAALTSMGNGAGRTKEQLADLAGGIMRNSLYDDDDILRQVTANLLTFGNVAGAQFDRAQVAAADLATRMGGDLQSATLMIGKALNDPAKGLSALRRVGIQFTAQQETQIKAMAKAGNAAGAQSIMLSELERQFGGSAAAAAKTDPYDKMRDALNDLSEAAGGVINRFLIPMTTALAGLFDKFNGLSPQMQTFAVAGAAIAAALGPALIAIGAIVGAVGTLTAALAGGGVLAGLGAFVIAAAPFIAAAAAIGVAVWAFRDDLVPIFEEFRKAVVDSVGPYLPGILDAAKAAFAVLGPAISAVVGVVGPILAVLAKIFLQVFGPVLITLLKVMAAQVTGALQIVGNVLRFVAALLTGDWKGAWNAAGSVVGSIVQTIGRVIDAVFPGALAVITRMVDGVKSLFNGKLFEVFKETIRRTSLVGKAFFDLYDAVVGHSYIPDMVEGVAMWMAKLDAGMVVPARRATDAAKQAFESLRDSVASDMEGLLSDTESAARDLAAKTKRINDLFATGRSGMTRGQANGAIAGYAGADLQRATVPTLNPLGTEAIDIGQSIKDGLTKSRDAFDAAAKHFGDAFAYNMEGVLQGDIKGVLKSLLSDVLRSSLSSMGAGLFKSAGGWSGIGASISSLFGGAKLPGFKTGGSFTVGGSGGLDSQVMAFRATPGEMVDVRKPGQQMGAVQRVVVTTNDDRFNAYVDDRAAPMAAHAGAVSYQATQQRDMNAMRTSRYSRRG